MGHFQTKLLLASTTALVTAASIANADPGGIDWNGWYIGAQVGITQHQATIEDQDFDWYGSAFDLLTLGGSAGVQAGFNSVENNRLLGFEAAINLLSNSEAYIYSSDVNIPSSANFLATLKARTGLAVDDTLLYVTGGLAYAGFDRSWTEFSDFSDSWPDLGASKLGVVVGFGIERALNDHWSVRGEYTASIFGENISVNPDGYPLRINDNIHRVSLAFNYSLGGGNEMPGIGAGVGTPADFSGGYIGAVLGAGTADISQNDIQYDYHAGTYDIGNTGGIVGATAGYNWQDGAGVFGVEARLAFSGMAESYDVDGGLYTTGIGAVGSLRARAGLAAGNTLMYVLGGLTAADVTNRYDNGANVSGIYSGLTVGVGVEQYISDSLSWNAEATYTLLDGLDDPTGHGYHGFADMLLLTAGVNYHIGGDRAVGSGALAPTHNWAGAYYGVDTSLLANVGSVWDQDYIEFGGQFDAVSLGAGLGGHIGHNWQNGSFVYGAVADIAFFTNDVAYTDLGYREVRSAMQAMATLRGRAGIASGNSLFYATGGLAAGSSILTHEYLPGPDTDSYDLSDLRTGIVLGLGMEHAVSDRASIKVEALMSKFGEQSYFNGDDCPGPPGFDGGACDAVGWDTNIQIKAGMSWSF